MDGIYESRAVTPIKQGNIITYDRGNNTVGVVAILSPMFAHGIALNDCNKGDTCKWVKQGITNSSTPPKPKWWQRILARLRGA